MDQSSDLSNRSLLICRVLNRINHPHSLDGGFDIMHANDMRAAKHGSRDGRHRAEDALVDGRAAQDVPDERLARCSDEHWEIRKLADELIQLGDQFDILFFSLTETDAGIKHDLVTLDTSPLCLCNGAPPVFCDFVDDAPD